jgi:hypothetical protein
LLVAAFADHEDRSAAIQATQYRRQSVALGAGRGRKPISNLVVPGRQPIRSPRKGGSMTDEAACSYEIESAVGLVGDIVAEGLRAGADRCVLASTCLWTGVREMVELTSAPCAASTLREIANQIEPAVAPRPNGYVAPDRERGAVDNEPAGVHRFARARTAAAKAATNGKQNIAGDVLDEAIELLDQGHVIEARALMKALRSRFRGNPAADFAVAEY